VALLGNTATRGAKSSKDGKVPEGLTAKLDEIAKQAASPEDAVEPALDAITESVEAAASAICFFDQRQQLLRLAAERGLSDEGCKSLRHVRRGLMGAWDMPLQSLNNRRAYVIQNAAQNRYVPPLIDDPKAMRTVTCLPLFASSTPVGSLVLVSTAPRGFSDAQLQSLDRASKALGRIIEAVRARANRLGPTEDDEPPEVLDREQWSRDGMEGQPMSLSATDPRSETAATGDRIAEQHVEESLGHKLAQARREAERAKEFAQEWERKHQELAGELAAAAAREQRLRSDLTATAKQLESFSTGRSPAPADAKTGAAHVAETARLQASLAEAESIAASERLRASDHQRKLTELTLLLQEATEREEELRRRVATEGSASGEAGPLPSESAQVARLRARVTDLEATLAAERSRVATLEETHADLAGKLGDSASAEEQYREGFQALATEFEIRTSDLLETLEAERTKLGGRIESLTSTLTEKSATLAGLDDEKTRLAQELAAVTARERTLAEEIEVTRSQHHAQQRELEERDAARAREIEALTARLDEAEARSERLDAVEAERARLAAALEDVQTERTTTEQEQTRSRAETEARLSELTTALEREHARSAEWERRHDALEQELAEVVERERARLEEALQAEETAVERAAKAEARSNEQAERAAELQEVRTRLAEVEAAAARATTRSTEWEDRCSALESSLDEERRTRSAIEAQLSALQATTAEQEEHDASRVAEHSALAERMRELEATAATAQRTVADATRRNEHLATELETATARAEAVERELEMLQRELARERADASGARAAAAADGDSVRTRLLESEARIETLGDSLARAQDTVERLQTAERELRQEMQSRDRELGNARERLETVTRQLAETDAKAKGLGEAEARARELEAQLQAMRTAMAEAVTAVEDEAKAKAKTAPSTPPVAASGSPAHGRPKASPKGAAGVKTDGSVSRLAVIDATERWAGVSLHGVDVLPVEPGADLHARLEGGTGDRVLINIASPAALDTLVAARAAGLTAPACGYVIGPKGDRALPLGFVEVTPVPVDTDQVLAMLGPFVSRGTRVLMAGGDADVFISLRQALSRSGASVSMAWDGKQGVDLLAMVSPEVVVVDLDLPPKGGLDLVGRLPQDEKIPVVAVIPGRVDQTRNVTGLLANPSVASKLVALDRLLEHARRTSLPKR
jgi:chromosome segregation ATPase